MKEEKYSPEEYLQIISRVNILPENSVFLRSAQKHPSYQLQK